VFWGYKSPANGPLGSAKHNWGVRRNPKAHWRFDGTQGPIGGGYVIPKHPD
ncbi:Hypothetical protein FKW44_014897, partial [Caligus rogercresseyi]